MYFSWKEEHNKKRAGSSQYKNIQCKKNTYLCGVLDPLRNEPPLGVVGEVVGDEHIALDERLQVLNLEVADLMRINSIIVFSINLGHFNTIKIRYCGPGEKWQNCHNI